MPTVKNPVPMTWSHVIKFHSHTKYENCHLLYDQCNSIVTIALLWSLFISSFLLGRGGQKIKEIQSSSGATIKVSGTHSAVLVVVAVLCCQSGWTWPCGCVAYRPFEVTSSTEVLPAGTLSKQKKRNRENALPKPALWNNIPKCIPCQSLQSGHQQISPSWAFFHLS